MIALPKFKMPEEVKHSLERLEKKARDFDKLLEELMRDWKGETYYQLSSKHEDLLNEIGELQDTLDTVEITAEQETDANSVELTDRKDEHGTRFHAVIIGE
jgi:archaellum component FlaC